MGCFILGLFIPYAGAVLSVQINNNSSNCYQKFYNSGSAPDEIGTGFTKAVYFNY